ncbi:MAG: hypothetical protein MHM6MM_002683 [Cercozoa sp. M6MM]
MSASVSSAPSESASTGDVDSALRELDRSVRVDERRGEVTRILKAPKLNPFIILGVPTTATGPSIQKQYRKLSLFVHPDKCRDFQEDARRAFEKLDKAKTQLLDAEQRAQLSELVNMARENAQKKRDEIEKQKRIEQLEKEANQSDGEEKEDEEASISTEKKTELAYDHDFELEVLNELNEILIAREWERRQQERHTREMERRTQEQVDQLRQAKVHQNILSPRLALAPTPGCA